MNHYLREAMQARGWTIPQLADACDVAVGLAQRWVSENPRYRVNPSPASCDKIAAALNVDLDEILAVAGHRPAPEHARRELTARQRAIQEQLNRWVAAVGPEYQQYFWDDLIAHGNATVRFLERVGTAVNGAPPAAVSAAVNRQPKRNQPERIDASRTLRPRLPTPQTLLRRALFAAPAVAAL